MVAELMTMEDVLDALRLAMWGEPEDRSAGRRLLASAFERRGDREAADALRFPLGSFAGKTTVEAAAKAIPPCDRTVRAGVLARFVQDAVRDAGTTEDFAALVTVQLHRDHVLDFAEALTKAAR